MLDTLYALSFQCGMNQRYYQFKAANAWSWDAAIMVTVAIVALVGTLLTVWTYRRESATEGDPRWWRFWRFPADKWELIVSILALVVASILNIAPTNRNGIYYSDMYRRWSDLRQDVDYVITELASQSDAADSDPYLAKRLAELVSKKNRIQGDETKETDQALLEQCWGDENESRTGYRTTDPKEKPRHGGEDSK